MVELQNLTKYFGDAAAVAEVNLTIRAGEFMTFLGPSGCGKTTLLRMISGFETPSSGAILLDGKNITHLPPYQRNVNQVFQSYALFPHLTVEENIAFGLKMQKRPKREIAERVAAAIGLVALGGMERRRPDQLSGGQRQRVALARALVCDPKVLLLDEPLSALDAKLRRRMQIELKRLQKKVGVTFVFVTHDQEEALTMSDRIVVMNKGRIEQLGSPAEIYHAPATAFVADFIGQTNLLPARIVGTAGGLMRIEVAAGIRLLIESERIPVGAASCTVSIRPEKIHLSRQQPSEANCLEAVVMEELFMGALDQLALRTPQGLTLTAVVANQSATQETWHVGEPVFCTLHPADLVVLDAR